MTLPAQVPMPIVNRIADYQSEIVAWRRDLHAHPELMYELPRTSAFVAAKLTEFGCDEVATGLGRCGVVGVIHGCKPAGRRSSGGGWRCGPTWTPCRSPKSPARPMRRRRPARCTPAAMTATPPCCSARPNTFARRETLPAMPVLVFQPAEEGGAGARAMMDDGLLDRFGIAEVYGMHNFPGLPVGQFATRPGPIMAASDYLEIAVEGCGRPRGAAAPDGGRAVGRSPDRQPGAVDRRPQYRSGEFRRHLHLHLQGGPYRQCRAADGTSDRHGPQPVGQVQDLVEARLREVVEGIARIHGATATLEYERNYPCW